MQDLKFSHQTEIAILIPSCDKYSDVWPYFFKLLDKYWSKVKQHSTYLLSNHSVYPDAHIQTIKVGEEKSWSDNVSFALKQINEQYVLVILEDFLLTDYVDVKSLEQFFCWMKEKDAGYLRLMANPAPKQPLPDCRSLGEIEKGADYRTSLQVAIWKKSVLEEILLTGESPWEFELKGSSRSNHSKALFLSITEGTKQPIPYFPNTIVRGLWVREAIDYLKQQNFKEVIKRPVETRLQAILRNNKFRTFMFKNVKKPLKELFQNE